MRKFLVCLLLALGIMFFTTNAFCYDINDPWPTPPDDRLGTVVPFETYGINAPQSGNSMTFSIFTNYPQGGWTVGGWHTFPGDLGIDTDLDGTYEHGIAFTSHNGLTAGYLYDVTSWFISDDYEPPPYNYGYNHDSIVTINGTSGSGIPGTVTWNSLGGLPNWRIDAPILLSDIGLSNYNGNIGLWWSTATCANDRIEGRVPVTPEPISSALFLLGGATMAIRLYRKKIQKA